MKEKKISKSHICGSKVIFEAYKLLKENNGEMLSRKIVEEIEKRVTFTEWEKEVYEKSGYVRWQALFHFFSIDSVKAGFIVKKKGKWYLTADGEKEMVKGAMPLFLEANKRYREWAKQKIKEPETEGEVEIQQESENIDINEMESISIEKIKNFLFKKNAYEFQDLTAALLRAMGYFTPFVAPRGKDGGIDIIAYRDPLGTIHPRIKVQVKHWPNTSIRVSEIRQLKGILKEGDVGIFITSSSFSSDSKTEAINSDKHIELIDLDRFINLWQEFYNKMPDEDKVLLPLQPIYFLADIE